MSPYWHDIGCWISFLSKTIRYLFYMVNIMCADVLATQGARASATRLRVKYSSPVATDMFQKQYLYQMNSAPSAYIGNVSSQMEIRTFNLTPLLSSRENTIRLITDIFGFSYCNFIWNWIYLGIRMTSHALLIWNVFASFKHNVCICSRWWNSDNDRDNENDSGKNNAIMKSMQETLVTLSQ